MRKKLFVIKMLSKVAKVDYSNYGIMCLQLNTIKSELAHAVFDGIITSEDYAELSRAIEETKEKHKNF